MTRLSMYYRRLFNMFAGAKGQDRLEMCGDPVAAMRLDVGVRLGRRHRAPNSRPEHHHRPATKCRPENDLKHPMCEGVVAASGDPSFG